MSLEITKITKTDAYEILGLETGASEQDIKHKYKILARACHPDKTGSVLLFQLINNAYQKLNSAQDTHEKSSETNTSNKTKTEPKTENKSQSAYDLIRDPLFSIPFKELLAAMEMGSYPVFFRNYSFMLTAEMARRALIKSAWPAKIEIKLYKNLFDYIFDIPKHTASADRNFTNGPKSNKFSKDIIITGADQKKYKYYRLKVNMSLINMTLRHQGQTKRATKHNPLQIYHHTTNPVDLTVCMGLEFTA